MKQLAVLTAIAIATSACALHPLYSGGNQGGVAQTLQSVQVEPIQGRVGWLMRNALSDRLGNQGNQPARYRLQVELDDSIIGLGIRGDSGVTRERRTLRARYRLIEAGKGTVVLDATAGSDAGIDVVSSEYATVAAEQSAANNLVDVVADQIIARLGVYATRTAAKP